MFARLLLWVQNSFACWLQHRLQFFWLHLCTLSVLLARAWRFMACQHLQLLMLAVVHTSLWLLALSLWCFAIEFVSHLAVVATIAALMRFLVCLRSHVSRCCKWPRWCPPPFVLLPCQDEPLSALLLNSTGFGRRATAQDVCWDEQCTSHG